MHVTRRRAVISAGDVGLFSMHRRSRAANKGTYGCARMPKVWRLTKGQDSGCAMMFAQLPRQQGRRELAMTPARRLFSKIPAVVLRYGLAVLSVGVALGISLFLVSQKIENVEFPLFLFAVALTVWYAGTWPGIVSVVLAALAFNYDFTEPRYSFYELRGHEDFPGASRLNLRQEYSGKMVSIGGS